jgi:hypothetical protein
MSSQIQDVQSILRRIDRLERQNRWFKRAGLAVLALGAAIAVMGQARPSHTSIKGEEFVVVDAEGRTRATLGMELGSPWLNLYDTSHRRRATLLVDGLGQPVLEFKDAAREFNSLACRV